MKINWFEFKYLDRSTNHSTETETLKYFLRQNVDIVYHSRYFKKKKYFGFSPLVMNYVQTAKIRYIGGVLALLVMLKRSVSAYFNHKNAVQIIDYKVLYAFLPILLINKVFKRQFFILDIRTYPVSKFYDKLPRHFTIAYKLACLLCDGVTYITDVMKQDADTWTSLKPKSYGVWGSGFSPDDFFPIQTKKEKDESSISLIYHGGLSVSRGILDLIKAVEICQQQGLKVSLTLIGVWVDKKELQEYVSENKLTDVIRCLEPIPINEIPALISQADFGILPFPDFVGWRVSSPIKLFEYLGMGKPVIVTDIACFNQLADIKPFAVVAESSSAENLAYAISSALKYKNEYTAQQKEISDYAVSRFTWQAQAKQLSMYVDRVLMNAR